MYLDIKILYIKAGVKWRAEVSMREGNPLGRLADARESGKAAVFLASVASSFITGALCGRRHGAGVRYWQVGL